MMSGPSAMVSQVPLELNDDEIKQGLLEGSRLLLDPQISELMKAVRGAMAEVMGDLQG